METIRNYRELEEPFAQRTVVILKAVELLGSVAGGFVINGQFLEELHYEVTDGAVNLTFTAASRTELMFVNGMFGVGTSLVTGGSFLACILQNNQWFAIGLVKP